MKPQPISKLITIIGLLALVGGIVLSCEGLENQPLEPVEAKKVIKKSDPLIKQKTIYKHEPYKVLKNKTHFIVFGAYPTVKGYEWKRWGKVTFKNYCPFCKKWNTLKYNPKRVADGEITCYKCGADYCAGTGKDKSYRCRKVLKRW
ncbi:hypothetical protein MBCUT_06640 [Methanobrevibacter cuticularis]|uniref:Uncharacterized protein n=1 Tax=Methanobrevibacter cuticularis TaxID=47311 RepID=A0A166EGG9_9EURY|nr:hypothetical protein [Methanobrevibacter cuticularis]KZX16626.1 hypothetical protein MBCUT_06640 [Methanobrevibacter cuticularis]